MKKLFLLAISFSFLLSCTPENVKTETNAEEVFLKIKEWEISSGKESGISLAQVDSCLQIAALSQLSDTCYSIGNLTGDFLPYYGTRYPDLIPTTSAYTQNVDFCTLGRIFGFVYERNTDGTISWLGNNGLQWDSLQWIIPQEISPGIWEEQLAGTGDFLQFQTYTQPCDGFQLSCNGNHFLTMRAWYQGAEYRNSGEIFVLINNAPVPDCITNPQIDLWYDPDEEIIFFPDPYPCLVPGTAKGDLNGDAVVNTADLTILLSNLCGG